MIVEILRHEIGALSWVGLEINRFRLSACSRDEGEQIIRTNSNIPSGAEFFGIVNEAQGVFTTMFCTCFV